MAHTMKRTMHALFFYLIAILVATPAYAAIVSPTIVINSSTKLATDIGDFGAIGSGVKAGKPGRTLNLLRTRKGSASNSVRLDRIYNTLLKSGITSTHSLVFGFSANERGKFNYVSFKHLQIDIERQDGSVQVFDLGGTKVKVKDQIAGKRSADALFQINLGFEFMQEYAKSSTRMMVIRAQLQDNTGRADRLFLSGQYTAHPLVDPPAIVPVPASLGFFSSALVLMLWRKYTSKTDTIPAV